jgi:hypothetical protein
MRRVQVQAYFEHTDILVLDIAPGLALELGLIERFVGNVLDEHFLHTSWSATLVSRASESTAATGQR